MKHLMLLNFMIPFAGLYVSAQSDTTFKDTIDLREVVITATQTERLLSDIPKPVTVVSSRELEAENNISIVDALNDKPGIWVEKRTTEASDPMIRGFAGYYIHALIDGHSLSTLAGEGGPAGSAIYGKTDPFMVQKIEVIRGPSSVLYGTNAIGGIVNFITKDPAPYSTDNFHLNGSVQNVYTSAANAGSLRGELGGSSSKVRFLLGGTYQNINDVTGGGSLGTLSPSSAQRYSFDGKSEFKLSKKHFIQLSFQEVRIQDHHRYYFPNETSDYLRQGLAVGYKTITSNFLWNEFTADVYTQRKQDRITNSNNSDGYRNETETITTAADLRLKKNISSSNHLLCGIHWSMDSYTTQAITDTVTKKWIKLVPDAVWSDIGTYLQDEWNVFKRLTLIPAIRYDRYNYNASPDEMYKVPNGFIMNDFDITSTEEALSGGLGIVLHLPHYINLTGNVSRGFRQPQPDLGVSKFTYGVSVPNLNLKPEMANTFELGLKTSYQKIQGSVNGYYTALQNFLLTASSTFNGQDWFDWNKNGVKDVGEDVYQKQNSGNGWVKGVETEIRVQWNILFKKLNPGWFLSGGFNWMDGYDESGKQPLMQLAPSWGIASMGFQNPAEQKYWCYVTANIVDKFTKIPGNQLADPAYWVNPQDSKSGMLNYISGYSIFTFRSGYEITKNARITLSVENFTNERYRTKGSRIDAPGINVVAGIILKTE